MAEAEVRAAAAEAKARSHVGVSGEGVRTGARAGGGGDSASSTLTEIVGRTAIRPEAGSADSAARATSLRGAAAWASSPTRLRWGKKLIMLCGQQKVRKRIIFHRHQKSHSAPKDPISPMPHCAYHVRQRKSRCPPPRRRKSTQIYKPTPKIVLSRPVWFSREMNFFFFSFLAHRPASSRVLRTLVLDAKMFRNFG